VHVHDLSAERDEFPEWHELVLRQGLRTTLSVPLLRENEAIGLDRNHRLVREGFSEFNLLLGERLHLGATYCQGESRLLACSSINSRTFSIAMTAWSANVLNN
jgi:hypothetical protein